jgi:hypothetical protein
VSQPTSLPRALSYQVAINYYHWLNKPLQIKHDNSVTKALEPEIDPNSTVPDLINALPGNSSVSTVKHATIDEAVFSMSSEPSSGGTTGLCNPFLSNGSVNTLLRKQ